MYDMKCFDVQESVMSYCTKSFESSGQSYYFLLLSEKKQGQCRAVLHLHIYCKSHYHSLLSKHIVSAITVSPFLNPHPSIQ